MPSAKNTGEAIVRSITSPAASAFWKSRFASLFITMSVTPDNTALHAHGMPSSVKGVSSKANEGQYFDATSPVAFEVVRKKFWNPSGTSRLSRSTGNWPVRRPDANAWLWNTGAYSSIDSGWL